MTCPPCTHDCEQGKTCPAKSKEPPQRTWVGLTDKAITKVVDSMPRGINGWMSDWDLYEYARAIEAKLKKNNGFAEEKNNG